MECSDGDFVATVIFLAKWLTIGTTVPLFSRKHQAKSFISLSLGWVRSWIPIKHSKKIKKYLTQCSCSWTNRWTPGKNTKDQHHVNMGVGWPCYRLRLRSWRPFDCKAMSVVAIRGDHICLDSRWYFTHCTNGIHHYQTTIWENMFYLFQASFSSQSKYGVFDPQLNLQIFECHELRQNW